MFLLTLKRISEENTFQDPDSEGVNLLWRSFFSEDAAKAAMMKDFSEKFDSDSSCEVSDSKIEIQMLNDKYVYEVSAV